MQELLFIGQLAAVQDMPAVGDDLIDIHIALGAAPRLPNDQWKIRIERPTEDLIANPADKVGLLFGEQTGLLVGKSGGFFEISEGPDDLLRHFVDVLGDGKILYAALGLGAIIGVD